MIDDGVIEARRLGGMVLPRELLAPGRDTALVRPDGRPQADFRAELRRIPSIRNALSVVGLYVQTALVLWATIRFGPWAWPIGFVLMGRAHAQFASLMHEAAHRLLFANRKAQRLRRALAARLSELHVDRRLPPRPHGAPPPGVRARRARHPALHRLPDRRRQPASQARARHHRPHRAATAARAVGRLPLVRPARAPDAVEDRSRCRPCCSRRRSRPATRSSTRCCGSCRTSPCGASSTGCARSPSTAASRRRATGGSPPTRSRQHPIARFLLVPYNIGWHLAHHVDAGVPFRNLPRYHQAMTRVRLRRRRRRVPELPHHLASTRRRSPDLIRRSAAAPVVLDRSGLLDLAGAERNGRPERLADRRPAQVSCVASPRRAADVAPRRSRPATAPR